MDKKTEELLSEISVMSKKGAQTEEASELETLRREKALRDNIAREVEEFYALFPDTDIEEIPDEVWEACQDGSGICAQYALWLRRREHEKATADAKNEQNSTSAPPDVSNEEAEVYFTPEAVQKMSKAEVEKNYSAIMESMKKWK